MPDDAALGLMHAFSRLFHGYELADRLGVQRSWWQGLLPVFADANRYQRQLERADPAVRRRKVETTLAIFDKQIAGLEGETTYERNLSGYSFASFPRADGCEPVAAC